MGQNLTEHEHESLHLTHTNPFEWDTQGTLHIYDDTEKDNFDFWAQIGIPAINGIVIVVLIFIAGLCFNWFQRNQAEKQQKIDKAKTEIQGYVDRAAQASGTRQKVLTDYSNRVSDLMLATKLSDSSLRNVLRGETLIALRRLDDKDEIRKYIDKTIDIEGELLKLIKPTTSKEKDTANKAENAQIAPDVLDGFNDGGELKGFLIRFLFDSKLLTRYDPIVDLRGANISLKLS